MKRILLIEDKEWKEYKAILSKASEQYHIVVETHGISGLNRILEEYYDLVILDMKLPDIGGDEILKELKEKHFDIEKIIVLTAYPKQYPNDRSWGIYEYLNKPVTGDDLRGIVERVLHGRLPVLSWDEINKKLGRIRNDIVGESYELQRVLSQVVKYAPTGSPVLITGESGTGKELVAKAIHHVSRREGVLVTINCTALPRERIESELFGHEKWS